MKLRTGIFLLTVCALMLLIPQALAVQENEASNAMNNAQLIPANEFVEGRIIDKNDVDFFQVDLEEPGYISLTFNHEYVETKDNRWVITLYNENGTEMVSYWFNGIQTKNGTNSIGMPAGTVYIKLTRDYYHADVPYRLRLNFKAADDWETEFNDNFNSADRIKPNKTVNGSIKEKNDVDFYEVELDDPGYITLSFNHDYLETDDKRWDIFLYNEDNAEIMSWTFIGSRTKNRTMPIGVPAGTYYLKLTKDYYGSTIPYELKLNYTASDEWETEFNNGFGSADRIRPNKVIYGTIYKAEDVDFYAVDIDGSGYINIVFDHDYVETKDNRWTVILYNEDNAEIITYKFNGNSTKNSRPGIGVKEGRYYVKVLKDYYHANVNYELTVKYTESDSFECEFNNSFGSANALAQGAFVSGRIMHDSDADFYRVSLDHDASVRLVFNHDYVESKDKFWHVTIYNADNYEIANYEFNGVTTENTMEYLKLTAGTYFVRVNKVYYYSTATYTLALQE